MKNTCIIIEDEPLAANVLEKYINQVPYLELKGVFHDALDSFQLINSEQIDIVFLDIQLSECSGLDFVKSIKGNPLIIFTTAFSEYALEAFEVDAVDYLLKPVEFSRFLKAVNKAILRLNPQSGQTPVQSHSSEESDYLFIKSDSKRVKIYFKDILYIEGMQKYVKVVTTSDTHIALLSLTKLSETLPESSFFRVHKSYIVNLDKIENLIGNMLTINNVRIPISKGQKVAFNNLIKDKSL